MTKILCGEDIGTLLGNRKLYIWGSGHFGASISRALLRAGLKLTGFLDTNMAGHEFLGYVVENPETVLRKSNKDVFIIISAFLFTDIISSRCEEYGFSRGTDYLTHADIKKFHFEIDVSGLCNLRCITCPRGNSIFKRPDDRMMSAADYKKVLDKLILEIPFLSDVQLYSWGEPLLNPEISEMISYTEANGIASAVSSNLSLKCDLESVLKAKPTWFRISLSGADEVQLATIHRGGHWDLVLENMKRLSALRDKIAPKMFVDVNYHLYRHNLDGVQKIAKLCKTLGFVFRTNYAFLDPLDLILDYAEGQPLPVQAEEGRRLLLLDIDEAIEQSKHSPVYDCVSQNSFVINSDLSFRRCTHFYNDKDNIISKNILDEPLEKILDRANLCELCTRCRIAGVQRFHFAYIDKGTEFGELTP